MLVKAFLIYTTPAGDRGAVSMDRIEQLEETRELGSPGKVVLIRLLSGKSLQSMDPLDDLLEAIANA